jgi:hypothetical protein
VHYYLSLAIGVSDAIIIDWVPDELLMITFSFPHLGEGLCAKIFLIIFLRIHPVEAEPLSTSDRAKYLLLDNYS